MAKFCSVSILALDDTYCIHMLFSPLVLLLSVTFLVLFYQSIAVFFPLSVLYFSLYFIFLCFLCCYMGEVNWWWWLVAYTYVVCLNLIPTSVFQNRLVYNELKLLVLNIFHVRATRCTFILTVTTAYWVLTVHASKLETHIIRLHYLHAMYTPCSIKSGPLLYFSNNFFKYLYWSIWIKITLMYSLGNLLSGCGLQLHIL